MQRLASSNAKAIRLPSRAMRNFGVLSPHTDATLLQQRNGRA
jgi:hypothetical protein